MQRAYHIGVYRVGECFVDLYEEQTGYCGVVYGDPSSDPADRVAWQFDALRGPACGVHSEPALAVAACDFGGYYSSCNRGADLPPWAPPAHVADGIAQGAAGAQEATEVESLPEWCSTVEVAQ
jgi:hypothetical protein